MSPDFIRALTEELRAWQDETLYLTELDVAAMLARAVARTFGLEHSPPATVHDLNEEDSDV